MHGLQPRPCKAVAGFRLLRGMQRRRGRVGECRRRGFAGAAEQQGELSIQAFRQAVRQRQAGDAGQPRVEVDEDRADLHRR